MVKYECMNCHKDVPFEFLRKRVRCPSCGHKIVSKPMMQDATVEAE